MPLQWEDFAKEASGNSGAFLHSQGSGPAVRLTLWPHRSLAPRGFVWFIGITFALFMLPLLALLGTAALWVVLPYLMGTLALVWYFLRRSQADGALKEVLNLWHDHVDLTRSNPRAPTQNWHANPHWVEVRLRTEGGPVENYITLRGNDRIVEIGAFLSPEERVELFHDLQSVLRKNKLR